MKKLILISFLLFATAYSNAQCPFLGNPWITYTPACTGGQETATTCAWAGEYITINVIAGNTYTFETCGATYDTELTLFTNNGATYIAENDDACGLQSVITWTATFTGTVQLQVNSWPCGTGTTCTPIYVTCSTGGGGGVGPCASINTIIGCGTSQSSTMTGTGSWNTAPCGWSTPGVESIWEFTPTTSGIHSIEVSSITGGFVDFAWMNATTGCGPTGWNCIDDVLTPGTYGSMNWIAGQTYYILLDPETTATTQVAFNVDCPNPSGYASGDCMGAIPLCSDENFAVDPSGYGTIDELCTGCISNPSTNPSSANSGCLLSGELNSTWMTINVAQGGTLEFSMGTPGSGLYCFDWIMWPYDPNACTDILNNTLPPEACNWNGTCDGFTGMSSTVPAGGFANNFEPTMNVNTGDAFVILLSNYSSAYTNVPIDFFGTADISCLPLPVEMVEFNGLGHESYNELTWSTASEVHCSHFNIERSTDGSSFQKIGEVEGTGTSFEVHDYRFHDNEIGNEIYYYRLKQLDFNGAYTYSNTIAIAPTIEGSFKVMSAFPNPATEVFNVQLYAESAENIAISIKSASGAVVYNSQETLKAGSNIVEIPVSDLARGMYMLTVTDGSTDETEIVKLAID